MNKRTTRKISPSHYLEIQAMLVFLLLLAMSFAIKYPLETYTLSFCLMGMGAVLMFLARLPLYRNGVFFSFGAKDLDPIHKVLYYYSYILLVPGCVLCIIRLSIDYLGPQGQL